jgi:hypothetical protein
MLTPDSLMAEGGGAPAAGTPPAGGAPAGTPPAGGGTPPAGTPPAGGGTPNTTPFFADLYGADGKINKAAFDRLPDHLKGHKDTFAKYDTVEALLGGMGNLANLAGKKGLEPLPAGAPAEMVAERDALMKRLNGVPEKPEGYGVKRPDNVPPEQWNDEYVGGMMGLLHKHNASPSLVKALVEADTKFAETLRTKGDQDRVAAVAQERGKLKDVLTAMPGGYDKNLALAVRGARTAGLDPNDAIFGDHRVVAAFAKFAGMISEDKLVSGDSADAGGGDDRAKALDIVNNKANPLYEAFHSPTHPQHDHAVQTRSAFNKRWLERQGKK